MPPWSNSDGDDDGIFQVTTDDFGSIDVEIDTTELRNRMDALDDHYPSVEDHTMGNPIVSTSTIERGHPVDLMDTPSIEYWIVDEALNRESLPSVEEAACGERYDDVEGAAAVGRLLVQGASREIGERAYGEDFVQPFNEVTSGWPREARAILIQYEYESADRPDCDYSDDLERFTSEGDGPNIPDVGTGVVPDSEVLSDLSPTYPRSTALLLYADGVEVADYNLDSISDHRRFRQIYESVEEIEAALRAERLDSRLPIQVASEADDPQDWPDDLEPSSVERLGCIRCGTNYSEVSIDGEATFVNEHGTPIEVTPAGPGEPYRFANGPPGSGCVCESCEAEFEAQSYTVVYIDPDTNAFVRTERAGDMIYDLGHLSGTAYMPESELPPNVRDRIDAHDSLDDHFEISPNSDFGNVAAQREAIEELAEEPTSLTAGPVIVRLSGGSASVLVERSNFDAACEVKETIEENVNNV